MKNHIRIDTDCDRYLSQNTNFLSACLKHRWCGRLARAGRRPADRTDSSQPSETRTVIDYPKHQTNPMNSSKHLRNPRSLLVMKITSIHLLTFSALLTGCHRAKPVEPQKSIVRVVTAESLDSAKVQARSEYIAMLKGDVETD